jgi:predicted extracellular nuclease/2',3'-cyclic-nucleotide 2'-phosphodiesterase (5'-nucleotidase family)
MPMSDAYTLQILHAADFEAATAALTRAPNFAAVVDALEEQVPNSITLSSGDNYLPGPFIAAQTDASVSPALREFTAALLGVSVESLAGLSTAPARFDIAILNAIGVQASVFGNHEFDFGPEVIAAAIDVTASGGSLTALGAQFPYLSANLGFGADPSLAPLFTEALRDAASFATTAADLTTPQALAAEAADAQIAPWTVIEENGERIGIVGVTTQTLASISSPGRVSVLDPAGDGGANNTAELAGILQPRVDALAAQGIDKVILLSHLQQYQLELELAGRLSGVDVVIAGGSDAIFADATDALRPGDTAQEGYPVFRTGADGAPVAVVNTGREYGYVGRLVLTFDAEGRVIEDSVDPVVSGAYVTTDEAVDALWAGADPFAAGTRGAQVQGLTDALGTVINAKDGALFGYTDVFLEGRRAAVRSEETNLGNLSAEANLAAGRSVDPAAVISIKNGGGIRAEIGTIIGTPPEALPPPANEAAGKPEGAVSQLDIENALRFNNGLALVTLTAQELVTVVENAVRGAGPGLTPGAFPQVAGLSFSFDASRPAGDRVVSLAVLDGKGEVADVVVRDGEIVGDAARSFRTVTLDFLANPTNPGDGLFAGTSFTGLQRLTAPAEAARTGEATFAADLSEQDALAEYLAARFATPDTAFAAAEAPAAVDTRIQNLAVRDDTVLVDAFPGPELTPIFEIQGRGHVSALEGEEVTASGVVLATTSNGFWMQDPEGDGDDATSDGIFVFTRTAPGVAAGDTVQVAGTVQEFLRPTGGGDTPPTPGLLTITQLSDVEVTRTGTGEVTSVRISSEGRRTPTERIDDDGFTSYDPATDGVDFWESLEGMAVFLPDARAVAPTFTSRFGDSETFVVTDGYDVASNVNAAGGLTLTERDDNPERITLQEDNRVLDNDYRTKVGDRLGDITGVVDYDSRGNYEVIATRPFTVTDGGLRKETGSALRGDEGSLLIATYNVENLNPSSDKFDALAEDIVAANLPDIIALQEVQDASGPTDDGTTTGEPTAAALIAAIEARTGEEGAYRYLEIPPVDNTSGGAPGANIRVGFLYREDRVEPIGGTIRQVPDPDAEDGFAWADSRVPLAVDFRRGEEVVTVVNNHFTSKGGSSPLYGSIQPILNGGEAQRVDQAEAVNAFVADLLAADPQAKVVVLGDLNEFEWEDAFQALTGGDEPILFDLLERLAPLPVERYGYVFDGNHQALDHILVTRGLLDGAEVDVLRRNAQFPDGNSDHDPILARLPVDELLGG